MVTENLSTLKIHKLTQEQYKRELDAGRIDPSALYLTPDVNIYTQNEEPLGVPDGSLWVDMDATGSIISGGSGSGGSGKDGISATHSWNGTVLTITSASGTSSADLKGENGKDGVSPIVTVTDITGGHRIAITDAEGEKTFEVMDGTGGSGEYGKDGISATHSWDGTVLTITSASGTSSADLKGEDGYTPQKGIDYFTESDREQIVSDVLSEIPESGDSEILIVNIDVETLTASHSASEIIATSTSGKIVFANLLGMLFQICDIPESGAHVVFENSSCNIIGDNNGNDIANKNNIMRLYVTNDKRVDFLTLDAYFVPTPSEDDSGKVLGSTETGLAWVEAPSNTNLDEIVTAVLAALPVYAGEVDVV